MNAVRKVFGITTLTAFLIVPPNCLGTMVVQGFTAARHDRFANDASFVGSAAVSGASSDADLSGVGRSGSGGSWATLLANPNGGTPTHIIGALHAQPAGVVNFFPGNDPLATPVACTVTGGIQIAASDIWVGSLDVSAASCDTSLVTGYELALDIPSHHVGELALQAGRSATTYNTAFGTTNMRFGRNEATQFVTDTLIGRTGDWMIYADDSLAGDLLAPKTATGDDLNPDETYFQGGDSGGPSFLMETSGTLKLFGIHSFIGEFETNDADGNGVPDVDMNGDPVLTPTRRLSGDSYLPSSRAAILAEITTVPEPSGAIYLGLITLAMGAWASRRFMICTIS